MNLNYTIMRPNGFFSDMRDFPDMAKNGKVYLFGKGDFKLNPIHGEDLAQVCVDKISSDSNSIKKCSITLSTGILADDPVVKTKIASLL